MGSPFLYMERRVLRVTFFLKLCPEAAIGACELYLVCHCDSNGFTAEDEGRMHCENRARDPFTTDIDRDMAENVGG